MPVTTTVKTTPVMAAGSVVEISFDSGTTFVEFPGLERIPQVGEQGSFLETTDIRFKTKTYTRSLRTPPEWEMVFRDIGDNAVQDQLIAAADNGDTVKIRVTWESGRVATFDLVLAGHYQGEAELEGLLLHAVQGQMSGAAVWSKVAVNP